MMKYMARAVFFCVLFSLCAASSLPAENYLARTMTMQIMVADPEATADLLANWAVQRGGYYTFKSTDIVMLRIPQQELDDLRRVVKEKAEETVSESFQALDLRETIVAVRSGMVSREEILQKNLAYIDKTDVEGTLAIEREITGLVGEIEQLKGKLRKLINDAKYARAEIQLSFMEKTLPHDIPSSFKWINEIDFYLFIVGGSLR
jgi:hypothetical protein